MVIEALNSKLGIILRVSVTSVNFDNFTFAALYCEVIETSNWFYFLSNALCYIHIKFRDHKLISLGTAVESIHSNIKNLLNLTF